MRKNEFCGLVLAQVRHATAEERAAIRAELEGHLEDHCEDLLRLGYPPEEAEARSLTAMGDPEEIGRALNREYPLRWLVLSRGMVIATALLCFTLLFSFPLLGHVFYSVQARIAPGTAPFHTEIGAGGNVALRDVSIKVPLGNDVLYIYQVGLQEAGDAHFAYLAMCNYDRNPFGSASGCLLGRLQVTTPAEGQGTLFSGTGAGNTGVYYMTVGKIQVVPGEDLLLTYDAYGERAEIRVPLPWEEAE